MTKLHRKKIGYGAYYLADESGVVIARIDKTGTRRDNYPWSWHLVGDFIFGSKKNPYGTEESLKACVSIITSRVAQYGLTTK